MCCHQQSSLSSARLELEIRYQAAAMRGTYVRIATSILHEDSAS